MARLGTLDHFSVDGLARRFGERWDLQAIEVNLRKGGTTHPMQALRYLSNGHLCQESGRFLSPTGSELHYKATDNFTDPRLRGLLPMDLIDLVAGAGLHYDALGESGSLPSVGLPFRARQARHDRIPAALKKEQVRAHQARLLGDHYDPAMNMTLAIAGVDGHGLWHAIA